MRAKLFTSFFAAIVVSSVSIVSDVNANDTDARVAREVEERELASKLAEVKSKEDLAEYVRKMPEDSALHALSDGGRERFLRSLLFTDRGLASFSYADLQAELTASQIYSVLTIFGAQHSTHAIKGLRIATDADRAVVSAAGELRPLTDYYDRRCVLPATCRVSYTDICIGANCGMIEP